jgi:hypothetical protein
MKRLIVITALTTITGAAVATDLSTVDTEAGRYLSVLGKPSGNTIIKDSLVPTGIHDIANAGGNAGFGWEMADGDRAPSNASNTFAGPAGPHYQGYKFKKPARVTSLDWANFTFLDGGTFAATPDVEVYDRGTDTWTAAPVAWSRAYDPAFGAGIQEYTITLDTPTVVDGVRLVGAPQPATPPVAPSPAGWIGTAELTVNGAVAWGVELGNDLTDLPNTTAIITHPQFGDPGRLIDNDLSTFETTVFAEDNGLGPEDFAGVLFDESQSNVGGLGVIFKRFGDGGVFDSFTIETYDLATDTWAAVSGLDTATYFDDLGYITTVSAIGTELGYLFTFDAVDGVDGVRIIGDGWGTAFDGFIAVTELEVFQVPEPATALLVVIPALALIRRR